MSRPTVNSSLGQAEDPPNLRWTTWLLGNIADLRELSPTLLCAIVTTRFTLHLEKLGRGAHESKSTGGDGPRPFLDVFLYPSPAVMIWACLILGCSVSSFVFRHRRQDRFQAAVFAVIVAWAAVLGHGLGSSMNLILLGFIPCSLSVAMLVSVAAHSLVRRWRSRVPPPRAPDDKEQSNMKV